MLLGRALDRVKLLQKSAVHPADIQLYLVRWSAWWARTVKPMGITTLLKFWIRNTHLYDPSCVWLARGILTIGYQLRYADIYTVQDDAPAADSGIPLLA